MKRQVNVRVKPGARINRVEDDGEGGFIVWTSAVPDKGKANEAVTRALAKHLGVAKSQVRLARGGAARRKVFEVDE